MIARLRERRRPVGRAAARIESAFLLGITCIVDGAGDRVRFGWGHAVRRRLLQRPLRHFRSLDADSWAASSESGPLRLPDTHVTVLLVTRTLGTGGVEAIVASLARRLPRHGVGTIVLCERGGVTADALRAEGVRVEIGDDASRVLDEVSAAGTPLVAQLHNAPDWVIEQCAARRIPLVPVIHTTDVNLSDKGWAANEALARTSAAVIAVSEVVRAFMLHHWGDKEAAPIEIVPNGVTPSDFHPDARRALGDFLGNDLRSLDVVFVCLARYDIQKNIPGLVSAFLEMTHDRRDAHLVVAGPIEDWLEFAHADAIRRADRNGHRVHLLGESSTPALLSAADAFVLDSFFEGWPVAASEAVMSGIPVVLSDVGGARELVGPDGIRGHLCDNPGGSPETLTLDDIRRARRRTARQVNRESIVGAMRDVIDGISRSRAARSDAARRAIEFLDANTMARAHARVLTKAAEGSDVSR